MSNQLLASKVVIQEEEPRLRSVPTLSTAVGAFVGVTEKGPVGTATLVNSFEEYVNQFGSYTANGDVTAAVDAFFANGGTAAYIVRTVHYTDVTSAATKTSAAGTLTLVDRAGSPISTLKIDGKYDGAYASNLKIRIEAPTSGNTDEFNLTVEDLSGVKLEIFPNLKIGTANVLSAQYVDTVINNETSGSKLIKATDLLSATAGPSNLPALGLSTALASGSDGLANIADTDFVGSASSKTGLYALDLADDVTLLAVPGKATSTVQNGMVTYAGVVRGGQIYCVFDPPAGNSATSIITYFKTTAALAGLSECGAFYWPRVKIANPKRSVYGAASTITVGASGHIMGMIARTDNARPGGVYDTPAGVEAGRLYNVLGVETAEALDEAKRDLVFPARINPITTFPGAPIFVDGARNLKGDGNWPTVAQRRGVSNIERAIKITMQSFRHKNNTPELRATIRRTIWNYLKDQTALGAFASSDPKLAFFVDVGDALNPPSQPNTITARIGLATAQPAEFIVLRFSQDTRAIDSANA